MTIPEEVTSGLYGAAIALASWFAGSGLLAWWQARKAHRRGVSADQREARRDTVADRDRLLDALERRGEQLAEEVETYRTEVAEARRRERIALDYAHALRADYVTDTGKAPRPWPAELASR